MSASTWGNPAATKHVLLLHGITSSSHSWHSVAAQIASHGYFVTAPDLLGHGTARRGSDYTVAGLVNELRPYFTTPRGDHPYDIIIGHSLGGVVATALLPLLKSTQPVHVVLCDPPLEQSDESVAIVKGFLRNTLANKIPLEDFQASVSPISKHDAMLMWFGVRMCDLDALEAILDQNLPWSFSDNLSAAPDNVKVTLLAADPIKGALVKEEDVKAYPRVVAKTVVGASHLIPFDAPQVVIETALECQ